MSRTTEQLNATLARIEDAQKTGKKLSHRELYPEQYSHEIVGKTVSVVVKGNEKIRGKVVRTINGGFYGTLIHVEGDNANFWRLADCTEV